MALLVLTHITAPLPDGPSLAHVECVQPHTGSSRKDHDNGREREQGQGEGRNFAHLQVSNLVLVESIRYGYSRVYSRERAEHRAGVLRLPWRRGRPP